MNECRSCGGPYDPDHEGHDEECEACVRRRQPAFQVGDAVRVERDEALYPSRGTWPQFRNRPGFVVMVSHEGGPAGEPEYGVVLTTTRPPWRQDIPGQLSYDSDLVSWFRPHELRHRREG